VAGGGRARLTKGDASDLITLALVGLATPQQTQELQVGGLMMPDAGGGTVTV
jgi:hypothetical protein